ncbi:HAD family hydrolase [Clostridium sp. WLY-B-L2]|uniref:HAD family hydrolase n=1 Tax=Clostridium aromativorans TaxID=2836848 RepID=A0ABS8N3D6_9CLOT|nr:HAD family hydrolase [Clostridium aromativorans]MCC9294309.1 HAD family hydrolase [Clostridium aromativorans]
MNLYISDLDGTLLTSEQVISKSSAAIINDLIASGMKFTVATARSYEASKNILKPLNLNLPVILNNGVFIYDPVSGRNIVGNYLDKTSVKFILEYYESKGIHPFISAVDLEGSKKLFYRGIFNSGQKIYVDSRRAQKDKRLTLVDGPLSLVNYRVINIFAIEKKGCLDNTYELFKNNLDVSCHYTEEIYSRGFFWLEATNPQGNKRWAAEFLKKYLEMDKMICFGDNLNDEPLFRIADEKYAVKNAYEKLKNLATGIIDSNNDDGVAKFLQKRGFLLKK